MTKREDRRIRALARDLARENNRPYPQVLRETYRQYWKVKNEIPKSQ